MALPAAIALSGLTPEHFSDGLKDVYKHGALLLKSPKLPSMVSDPAEKHSQERSILVKPTKRGSSVAISWEQLFNMLLKTQEIEPQAVSTDTSTLETPDEIIPKYSNDAKIIYQNRNLLDLATNIEWNWDFKIATIQDGTDFFFANRSQYSRVSGAHIPEHDMISCSFEDCEYQQPDYK